ncbi:GNAT family N-acetyltransferase [Flavobacterium supellecticarium]|uniref:GNAT family N-acetyltransferase n=1 Tax=Flavobacterium supellecticarium TaxID=2565924 RepID=A0A4S4A5B4_9FLAO|nr:GNAT family N-acetyltransferase [Flavobacterium supellecticarium]THF53503.1 GNAT family N-acetyltransferase [Flavobacterium supellecticarium]
MITIKEALTQKEMTDFVTFPFQLYKNNPYWVPPLIKDELKSFNPKNDIFKSVTARYFLAYQDGKLAGRIAAIINWTEVNTLHKSKVRFGWFDVIDNIEVTKALLDKVIELGKEHNLEYMEGPVGFSNMDKAGMLTEGFDQIATMIGLYNHAYYPEHLEKLGFTKEAEWLEYKIDAKQVDLGKIEPLSRIIEQRYAVKSLNFKSTKDIIPYVDEMFGLLNKTYAELQSFVPIEQFQIDHYKEKYISFIHPDFITCVTDKDGKMIAFGITMPSFSKAFQKANGKLFPFGFLYLLRAMKKNDHAEFYLIGVDPEYQNKGVTALILKRMYEVFTKRGILTVETNPQLEENKKIQQLWKNFSPIIHKRRKTFRKDL